MSDPIAVLPAVAYYRPPIAEPLILLPIEGTYFQSFDLHAPERILEAVRIFFTDSQESNEAIVRMYRLTSSTIRIVIHPCSDETALRRQVLEYALELWNREYASIAPPKPSVVQLIRQFFRKGVNT